MAAVNCCATQNQTQNYGSGEALRHPKSNTKLSFSAAC
jgi:hypothetical protein